MQLHDEQVDPGRWRDRCWALAAGGADMLDLMTAVDHPLDHQVEVVIHLVDVRGRRRHLVRTRVDRTDPALDSIADVLPGAAWREREVHEMFGVGFPGNDDLRPLLTTSPPAPPLLRSTALPARLGTPWPGARDPSDRPAPGARAVGRPRTPPAPPGVPREWST